MGKLKPIGTKSGRLKLDGDNILQIPKSPLSNDFIDFLRIDEEDWGRVTSQKVLDYLFKRFEQGMSQ